MIPSSTATDCGNILLMAHSVAFESNGSFAARPLGLRQGALTPIELRMLASIAEAISLGSEGADAYASALDQKLSGSLTRLLPAFQQGLSAVDLVCQQQTGSGIAALEIAERRMFLRKLQSGHKLTAFFGMLTCACTP